MHNVKRTKTTAEEAAKKKLESAKKAKEYSELNRQVLEMVCPLPWNIVACCHIFFWLPTNFKRCRRNVNNTMRRLWNLLKKFCWWTLTFLRLYASLYLGFRSSSWAFPLLLPFFQSLPPDPDTHTHAHTHPLTHIPSRFFLSLSILVWACHLRVTFQSYNF